MPAAAVPAAGGGWTFPREIRLGLVMYGGVSLAVYINGVATEFFHAVQGTGVYGLLKCLRNSHIAVDIISGASAGGINGILLGCALSGEDRDLEQTTSLWRAKGGIAELLHRPGTTSPSSLFDGESYYLGELTTCFRDLTVDNRAQLPGQRIPSPVDALDLFVTGTDYHGKTWLWRDALDSVIQVRDHRGVFRLRYRRSRPDANDFSDPAALAKLARITSSYPAALAPVRVEAAKSSTPTGPARPDEWLSTWGDLTAGTTRHFIDGGVLDNKPFTDTIEQIYYRTAHLPVDRKLFFVEPDPEATVAEDPSPPAPDILGVITRSLVTLPRYESIAADLRQIERLNRNIENRAELVRQLGEPGLYPPPLPAQAELYRSWRWRWLEDLVRAARGETAATHGQATAPVIPKFGEFSPAVDVEFSLRRLFHVTYRLYDEMYVGTSCVAATEPVGSGRLAVAQEVLWKLNRHIQLLKLARWAVARAVISWAGPREFCDAERRDLGQELLRLLAPLEPPLQERTGGGDYLSDCTLDVMKRALARRLVELAQRTPTPATGQTLLDEEETLSVQLLSAAAGVMPTAALEYRAFATLDTHLYLFEMAGGIREKDRIETIRISARDAQLGFSGRRPEQKVSGDALAHFGGFFKRTWRSNDILWGRLDARCQLVRGLLGKKELAERLGIAGEREAIGNNLDAFAAKFGRSRDELIATLFPQGSSDNQKVVQDWLKSLLSSDRETSTRAVEELDGVIGTLVTLAQADIVSAGIADVEKDARDEAAIWREPDFEFPKDLKAADLARSPSEFGKHYNVGEERLSRDIPPRVLLRTFAHGALILRDAVFGAADQRVKKNGRLLARPLQLTRKVLGWPLQLAYWYATVTTLRSIRLGLAVVAVTLLSLLFWLGEPLLGATSDGASELRWPNVFVFLGVPGLVLSLELALGQMPRPAKDRRWRRRLFGWLRWGLFALLRLALVAGPILLLLWGIATDRYAGLAAWFSSLTVRELILVVVGPLLLLPVLLYLLARLRPSSRR